jgi:hypothetical protein
MDIGTILRHTNGEIHVVEEESTKPIISTLKFLLPEDKNQLLAHYYAIKLENIGLQLESTTDSIAFVKVFKKLVRMNDIILKYSAIKYYEEENEEHEGNEPIPITARECMTNVFLNEDLKDVFSDKVVSSKKMFDNQLSIFIDQMNDEHSELRKEYIRLHTNIVNMVNEHID